MARKNSGRRLPIAGPKRTETVNPGQVNAPFQAPGAEAPPLDGGAPAPEAPAPDAGEEAFNDLPAPTAAPEETPPPAEA